MKRVKRYIAFLSCFLLLAGCTGRKVKTKTTQQKETPSFETIQDTVINEPLYERLEGTYEALVTDEEGERFVQITYMRGVLLMEEALAFERSIYSFWLHEIHFDDMSVFTDTETNSLTGMEQCFSMMSNAGMYWNEPQSITISISDDQLTVQEISEGEEVETVYKRIEADIFFDFSEQEKMLESVGTSARDDLAAGLWAYESEREQCYMSLEADGTFSLIRKQANHPVFAVKGIYGIKDDHILLRGHQFGYGSKPQEYEYEYTLNDSNELLYLIDVGRLHQLFNDNITALHQADENDVISDSYYQ